MQVKLFSGSLCYQLQATCPGPAAHPALRPWLEKRDTVTPSTVRQEAIPSFWLAFNSSVMADIDLCVSNIQVFIINFSEDKKINESSVPLAISLSYES